jgi:5-methylcytosine-specific restriction endonuclease McrA
MRTSLPDGITRADILGAIELYEAGTRNGFGESTDFDLVLPDGRRFPPKAIAGIAATRVAGRELRPPDFSSGEGQKCFRILREHGFEIVPKIEVGDNATDAKIQAAVEKILRSKKLPKPAGTQKPKTVVRNATVYERSPAVVAYVLQEAKGHCEACGEPAPFVDENGIPFLEVHHLQALGEGGADTVENALAACPNCHRRFHHSADRGKFLETTRAKIPRLQTAQK